MKMSNSNEKPYRKHILFKVEMAEKIKTLCRKTGQTFSEFVRSCVRKEIARQDKREKRK